MPMSTDLHQPPPQAPDDLGEEPDICLLYTSDAADE